MKEINTKNIGSFVRDRRYRLFFWLTVGMLIVFCLTPRGYAMAASSNESTSTSPTTFPYKKVFVISSYYSPLPGQSRYATGSFEGDVRLNGEGVHSADGSKVYPGMAAAPKTYPFGTKLEIPGVGIVAVHDRGGAIINNRLDLWMGEGEEGLRRALAWGLRSMEVTVYGIDESIKEHVSFNGLPLASLLTSTPQLMREAVESIVFGDNGDHVRALQNVLKRLGHFEGEITGFFGEETTTALKQFQKAVGIIKDDDENGAGVFGPRTRAAFEEMIVDKKREAIELVPMRTFKIGESADDVKNLIHLLQIFGYLQNTKATTFTIEVRDALTRLQIDLGLVVSSRDKAAGYIGPKTQDALKQFVTQSWDLALLNLSIKKSQSDSEPFTKSMSLKENSEEVAKVQEYLRDLNFFAVEPTGYFGDTTKNAVKKFQLAFNIVDEHSPDIGTVGPKTLARLNELALARREQKRLIGFTTEQEKIVAARLKDEHTLLASLDDAADSFILSLDVSYGQRGDDVERLQTILKRLGFFPGRVVTDYFGDITKQSLIAFQQSHGLEKSGALDANTRRVIQKLIKGA